MNVLQVIQRELQASHGLSVSVRGTGAGVFLYARSPDRSVEVYADENSGFVVECWNSANENSDDPPVSQENVPSTAAAIAKVRTWLVT
jgi:hypothetical protein